MQLRSRPEVRTIPQVATSPVLVPGRTRSGVLKIEEALRVAFGRGSVGRGVLEVGEFGRFVSPWAARHEGKFVCFVVSATKQLRAASVSEWAQGGAEQ